jgi:hypothetical protein
MNNVTVMLRREPTRTTSVSDWELGLAAVLLLLALLLTTIFVPAVA